MLDTDKEFIAIKSRNELGTSQKVPTRSMRKMQMASGCANSLFDSSKTVGLAGAF